MKQSLLSFLFICSTLFCACTDPEQETGPEGTNGKSGYLVGKVTDQRGNGVAGATVFTENTVFKGRGAEVTSKNDGSYQMAVAAGLGQWTVDAYTLVPSAATAWRRLTSRPATACAWAMPGMATIMTIA
ncbi:hypothetical protein [Dyadobacter beijingensis]|uniref:hypothetical protein n=1 Tax=Dyadobacter beijingensis TaxID=365489 RepID=UPI0003A71FEF|nr:hypothetical protein [Dyadobacter beijingensis]